jgi:hypothetical protein
MTSDARPARARSQQMANIVCMCIEQMASPLLVLSCSDRPRLHNITRPVLSAYCSRRGYAFAPCAPFGERHASWCKIKMLKAACEMPEPSDYAVFLDDDVLVTNPRVNLLRVLRDAFKDPRTHIVLSADALDGYPVNCGTIAVRCGPLAAAWLADVWQGAPPHLHHTGDLEQGTITMWLAQCGHAAPHLCKVLPHRVLQSFHGGLKPSCPPMLCWARGDFSCHFTPGTQDERVAAMQSMLEDLGDERPPAL